MSAFIHAPRKAPRLKRSTFDCSIKNAEPLLRAREIRATTAEEAKRLYIALLVKALAADVIDAVEVDVV